MMSSSVSAARTPAILLRTLYIMLLNRRAFILFKDDEKLGKGKTIEAELFKAIKESRFAVVILSKNYASSTWCLNELVEIVACEKVGMTIVPIFYNVDPSDVRKQKGVFAQPFDEYEKKSEEKVGTWRAALNRVANISGCHVDNSPLCTDVERIAGQILQELSREFSDITEDLVGIESPMLELKSYLALWLKDEVRFIGIWAMGGMGKTTLAKVAYKMFSKEFEACCFIDDVRENYKQDQLSLQKNLISQILNDTNLNIKNKCEGEHMIRNRLRGKRILLVLDDVDDLEQLQMLAGKRDWFGRGSRIIITTRDKHLLEAHLIDKIYEVEALKNEDALHLFCLKAFNSKLIPDEYLELSRGFLKYVAGHPLALIVLGSFLCKRSVVEWENEFEKLKEHPELDFFQVLKISYDGLDGQDQEIFKDIACFFNHEREDYVVQILKDLGRYPVIGFSVLIDKSLLKISENNELWMHDLVEDMARNIILQESLEPGERSRLWHYKDIEHVLKNNTGTKKVQAIDIKGAKYTSIYLEEKEGSWNPNAFLKMHNLKFLRIRSSSLQLDTLSLPLPLPNNLSYLEWNDYPLKSLHSLPAELVALRLPRSKVELLWGGMKIFENLKSIIMDGSSNLIVAPNFNGVPNLEELVLVKCSNLRKLHPSIGKLKKLKLLDLKECQELTCLPDKFEMESLVILNLTNCLKVTKIPEFVGNMKLLPELILEGTAIIELPSSVECLTGLKILSLKDCKNLACLPNSICSLTSLMGFDLRGCSKFDKLPKDLGYITSIRHLFLNETAIKELPLSVEFLIGLTSLFLDGCKNFVHLPSTICSLKSLEMISLRGCSKFDKLPEGLGKITSLKHLCLSGTAIRELPSSVEFLIGLTSLILEDCKNFVLLPSTVCNLKSLNKIILSGCSKFDKLPENVGILYCLCSPHFDGIKRKGFMGFCLDGTAIEVLPSSIACIATRYLNLKGCKNLVCLPSSICNLKWVNCLNLTGCTKIANLPENLGNMECLARLLLGRTAIKELPSSAIHLEILQRVSFKGCQLSSSSLTSMPRSFSIDLSDCSLSAIPSGIVHVSMIMYFDLFLGGNDFISLPESISQFSGLFRLSLDGCKRLRSLSNIRFRSNISWICVDNCTSLVTLPERENDFYPLYYSKFTVQCFNCFKLASNIENFSNMFQVQSRDPSEKCYIIPGREIPKWFEKVNICDTQVGPRYKTKKVKIQLPGSGSGFDEWRGIVLCVVFLPTECHLDQIGHYIRVNGLVPRDLHYGQYPETYPKFTSEYGKVESHHLWLHSVSKKNLRLPKFPGCSIDKKGFHQIELEIMTRRLEVEKIGFRVL